MPVATQNRCIQTTEASCGPRFRVRILSLVFGWQLDQTQKIRRILVYVLIKAPRADMRRFWAKVKVGVEQMKNAGGSTTPTGTAINHYIHVDSRTSLPGKRYFQIPKDVRVYSTR